MGQRRGQPWKDALDLTNTAAPFKDSHGHSIGIYRFLILRSPYVTCHLLQSEAPLQILEGISYGVQHLQATATPNLTKTTTNDTAPVSEPITWAD